MTTHELLEQSFDNDADIEFIENLIITLRDTDLVTYKQTLFDLCDNTPILIQDIETGNLTKEDIVAHIAYMCKAYSPKTDIMFVLFKLKTIAIGEQPCG